MHFFLISNLFCPLQLYNNDMLQLCAWILSFNVPWVSNYSRSRTRTHLLGAPIPTSSESSKLSLDCCLFCSYSNVLDQNITIISTQYSCSKFEILIENSICNELFHFFLSTKYDFNVLFPSKQPLCTPISASSKVIQLMAIVRSGSSRGISATTWFISAFTNMCTFTNLTMSLLFLPFPTFLSTHFTARGFTIYLDSADSILLCNFGVSTLLSAAVLSATITFSPGSPALKKFPPPGYGPTYVAYASQLISTNNETEEKEKEKEQKED